MSLELYEQAGSLEIEYQGEPLDLRHFGQFHVALALFIEKVIIGLFRQENVRVPEVNDFYFTQSWLSLRDIIRVEVSKVQIGSLNETIAFVVYVLAQPDMRAILQNLAANVVWTISTIGAPYISRRQVRTPEPIAYSPLKRESLDIGQNLREVMMAILSNGDKDTELTFRYRSPSQEVMEVTLHLKGDETVKDLFKRRRR